MTSARMIRRSPVDRRLEAFCQKFPEVKKCDFGFRVGDKLFLYRHGSKQIARIREKSYPGWSFKNPLSGGQDRPLILLHGRAYERFPHCYFLVARDKLATVLRARRKVWIPVQPTPQMRKVAQFIWYRRKTEDQLHKYFEKLLKKPE